MRKVIKNEYFPERQIYNENYNQENYQKHNLENSIDVLYGKAIQNGRYYDIIDSNGNLTGEKCNCYLGWNKGDGYEEYDYN